MRRIPCPPRASALVAALAALGAALATAVVAASSAAATAPPEPPPPSAVTVHVDDGVATAPDGTFTAAFAVAPTYTPSADGQPERFHADADEDAQEIARFGLDGFGAAADASQMERARLFIAASGTSVEWIANSPTRLGPDPAAHFIARLTLGDGRPAVVYGLVVTGAGRVTYVFATDVGGDDPDRSRAFVASFTSLLSPPVPVAPSTTTTTTSTTTAAVPASTAPASSSLESGAPTSAPATSAPATPAPATSAPPASATTTSVPTTATSLAVSPAPVGAVTSPDGAWWVTFPDDADVVATASTDRGFAYTEYRTVIDGDVLAVRAVETPEGYDWDQAAVPGFPETSADGEPTTVGATSAVASTFEHDGATVTAVVVHTGAHLLAVTYADSGPDDTEAAEQFVGSLGLAG